MDVAVLMRYTYQEGWVKSKENEKSYAYYWGHSIYRAQ